MDMGHAAIFDQPIPAEFTGRLDAFLKRIDLSLRGAGLLLSYLQLLGEQRYLVRQNEKVVAYIHGFLDSECAHCEKTNCPDLSRDIDMATGLIDSLDSHLAKARGHGLLGKPIAANLLAMIDAWEDLLNDLYLALDPQARAEYQRIKAESGDPEDIADAKAILAGMVSQRRDSGAPWDQDNNAH